MQWKPFSKFLRTALKLDCAIKSYTVFYKTIQHSCHAPKMDVVFWNEWNVFLPQQIILSNQCAIFQTLIFFSSRSYSTKTTILICYNLSTIGSTSIWSLCAVLHSYISRNKRYIWEKNCWICDAIFCPITATNA